MIPKIIHTTWKNKNIPVEWNESHESCKKINEGYTHRLWTDDDMDKFVKDEYPSMYDLYKSYKYHIQRCDAFRYMVLYKYGGIYIDLDIGCKKSLDDLLNNPLVLVKSQNVRSSFTNSFMMVKEKHEFMKYCIDNLKIHSNSLKFLGKHFHIMNSTGPSFLTKMVQEFKPIDLKILNKEDFSGNCTVCTYETCTGGNYFFHVDGRSWNSIDSVILNFIICNKQYIFLVLLFSFSFYFFLNRY
jgi:mannosyltransferase OCH1-like enzyme